MSNDRTIRRPPSGLTLSLRRSLSRTWGVDPDHELTQEDFISSIIRAAKESQCR